MGDVGIMGLHVPGMSWREIRGSAVLAEELGYSCLTMGESWGEDAFTSLAQRAAVTSRIRVGTSIVPVFARSPANLAMTALNLDRVSEGRSSRVVHSTGARLFSSSTATQHSFFLSRSSPTKRSGAILGRRPHDQPRSSTSRRRHASSV